ncbi:RraA family protein [Ottowia sp. VDI28]|uniref:RraA family protein n=1 Tax=Ottowia sp. VDI28 TaxID=3133968 RepID=UPI003C2D8A88
MPHQASRPRPLTGRVPASAIRCTTLPRLDPALLDRARALPDLTANISDAMDELGLRGVVPASCMACQLPGARIAGQAVTVRNTERTEGVAASVACGRGLMGEHEAYNQADPGDVVVIEGLDGVSNLGGQSAMVASRSECAGAIIDGGFRDPEVSRQLGFPIWSRGPTPITGKWRLQTVEINGSVRIAGVAVHAGDLVVADEAGIAFIPHAHALAVITAAERIASGDTRQQADIRNGISPAELASTKYK